MIRFTHSHKPAGSRIRGIMCATLLGACAQASSPPGAPPDRLPPRIVSTVPEQGAIVPNFRGPVRIRFDETLSERGARLADVIAVSPEAANIDVHRGGRELRIQLEHGWQPGRVYHVTVFPGLQDRFGNARNAAYELVFSTGPDIAPSALGGIVIDRLTRKPVQNARVAAVSVADSVAYATQTDTAGFYALRSLPAGTYRVTAFIDQNRNRKVDNLEARDARAMTVATARDTLVAEFSVLALDTTPSRLLRAEARDTQQVRLVFDDFMEPDVALNTVRVSVFELPDSTPLMGTVVHVREIEARERERSRDTTAARPPAVLAGAPPDTVALPTQELVWLANGALRPRTRYRVIVQGVRNISGIPGGAGSITFETPTRARLAPPDTTRKVPAKPDTAKKVVRDTTVRNVQPNPPSRSTRPLKRPPLRPDTSHIRS